MNKKIFSSARFKHGSMAMLITVCVIIAVILVNVIAGVLWERYPLNIDLTSDGRFGLTEETITFVEEIDMPIDIFVCAPEDTFENASEVYKQAYEIINNYAKYNSNIQISYIDLEKNPTFAQGYPGESLAIGDIIIQSDLRMRKFASSEMFERYQNSQTGETMDQSHAEQTMTAALMYVTDEETIQVSLLTGNDSIDLTGFVDLLKTNNYEVTEQSILTDEINQDAEFVILPQQVGDYTPEQIDKLNTYLNNNDEFGKYLIYVPSHTLPTGDNTAAFLADWGLQISDELIYETNADYTIMNGYNNINFIAEETLTEQLKNPDLPIVAQYAKAIIPLFVESDNRFTQVLVETSEDAVLVPSNPPEDFNPAEQPRDAYGTIVKGGRVRYDQLDRLESAVIAIGSSLMIDASNLTYAGFNNNDVVVSIINSIAAKEETISILPIEIQSEWITITSGQVNFYTVLFTAVVPLTTLAIGTFVFFKRRHM